MKRAGRGGEVSWGSKASELALATCSTAPEHTVRSFLLIKHKSELSSAFQRKHGGHLVVVVLVVRVVARLLRRRPRLRRQAGRRRGSRGKRQVPVQLRRQDPASPLRRGAALRWRRQPRALRQPLPPFLRAATEAEGHVRVGGGEPAVPAAHGGPGRARLCDERRRPRQPDGGVRRGQPGPAPAAQDPGVPVPEDYAATVAVHPVVRVQADTLRPPPTPHESSRAVVHVPAGASGHHPSGSCSAPAALPPARSRRRGAVAAVPSLQRQPLAVTIRSRAGCCT